MGHQKSIIRTFLFERFLRVYKKTPTGINPCRCFCYLKYSAAAYPIKSLPPWLTMIQSQVYPSALQITSCTTCTVVPLGMQKNLLPFCVCALLLNAKASPIGDAFVFYLFQYNVMHFLSKTGFAETNTKQKPTTAQNTTKNLLSPLTKQTR